LDPFLHRIELRGFCGIQMGQVILNLKLSRAPSRINFAELY
jgi:hypothetical protein